MRPSVRSQAYAAGADARPVGCGQVYATGADETRAVAAAYGAATWARRAVDSEAVALGWGLGGGHARPRTWRRRRTRRAGEAEHRGEVEASMAARLEAIREKQEGRMSHVPPRTVVI